MARWNTLRRPARSWHAGGNVLQQLLCRACCCLDEAWSPGPYVRSSHVAGFVALCRAAHVSWVVSARGPEGLQGTCR